MVLATCIHECAKHFTKVWGAKPAAFNVTHEKYRAPKITPPQPNEMFPVKMGQGRPLRPLPLGPCPPCPPSYLRLLALSMFEVFLVGPCPPGPHWALCTMTTNRWLVVMVPPGLVVPPGLSAPIGRCKTLWWSPSVVGGVVRGLLRLLRLRHVIFWVACLGGDVARCLLRSREDRL